MANFKERPILFNAEMVRAILNGSKTQTRRVVKLPHNNPLGVWEATTFGGIGCKTVNGLDSVEEIAIWHTRTGDTLTCPYGKVGDQFWVRETWRYGALNDVDSPSNIALPSKSLVHYEADGKPSNSSGAGKVRVSIHMPRWASRIQLEITSVRVERLNDITRGDCMSEGCPFPNIAKETDPKAWYQDLWTSINGADSWEANPWVWVIEFIKIDTKVSI